MNEKLAPSKSTVYISNLPFSLTNNDLYKLLEDHGKIVKVTVVKDKRTRRSKGVAFVLFLTRDDAINCASRLNNTEIGGRTVKSSIAVDNGRATEFIRRRDYPDKSFCYECGEEGHLSYQCQKNTLGERAPPPKKLRKRRNKEKGEAETSYYDSDSEDGVREPQHQSIDRHGDNDSSDDDQDTLSSVIQKEQEKRELELYRQKVATGQYESEEQTSSTNSNKRFKKSAYFSDEEELSD